MFSPDSNQFYLDRKLDDPASATAPPPPFRRLRGYAFDPSLALRLDTASMNQAVFETPWERKLDPGPVGEYVEVLDYDPASGCWYEPVDLNKLEIVAQDGLAPSEGNPQFHQQMVYAATMNTIANFEHALGRQIFWAALYDETQPPGQRDVYVQRLRIYPHALRAANAYYSPNKRALLFGYFPGPSGMVFSCLSHDIVAHETTHALLDGMHRRFIEDNHEDSLAFHEAFADLVALFEHFMFPEVLRHQIAQTRGDLASQSLLGELAQQFGEATGRYGALRSAIGERGPDGKWHPIEPDPARLGNEFEPHARGAILVAAVFGAFLAVNKARVEDLIRLATAGTGVLPAGSIHPDLVNRLTEQANATAKTFLNMCIRALDYCPPVDMTFGDYLRALVTADFDMVPNDRYGYRVALIESFRRWGILPKGLRTLSEEQLRLPFARMEDFEGWGALTEVAAKLRPQITETLYVRDRRVLFHRLRDARGAIHEYLEVSMSDLSDAPHRPEFNRVTGLNLWSKSGLEGLAVKSNGIPYFEVHALRPALRVSPAGTIMKQLIMVLTQVRRVFIDPENRALGRFEFRGGATLIFDLEGEKPSLRYAITRRIDDEQRLAEIRGYRKRKGEERLSLRGTYFGTGGDGTRLDDEPLSLLHSEA
ncbi:MAG: hypothetical protein HY322_00760 [Betaproteobacteria bacterium]|nr:hypothetical protein [Betaproteobacteria bacterium]